MIFALAACGALLLVYRVLLISLPFFSFQLRNTPLVNILCGLLSDLSFLGFFLTIILLAGRRRTPFWLRLGVVALTAIVLAVHIRYVEHFGLNFRPYHFAAGGTPQVWWVGTFMVLQSWRAQLLLGLGVILLVLVWRREGRTIAPRAPQTSAVIRWMPAAGVLTLSLLAHTGTIQLRNRPGVHTELRYNPVTAFYYNWKDYARVRAIPVPGPEQLSHLRNLLAANRTYVEEPPGGFPVWQERIASGPGPSSRLETIRRRIREHMAAEAKSKGPWNVVFILSESLRAHELETMGQNDPQLAPLTPFFSEFGRQSLRFTNLISAGLRTHYGQTTSMCSLYGSGDFSLLSGAPMTNAVCLPDIFAGLDYDTQFFYGADNHFDNQDIFYAFHNVRKIHDENDIPAGKAKGGWGYSDHALFEFAADKLRQAGQPFFALVLTLTNHAPFVVPADVPEGVVDREKPLRIQLLQYVDWSTGAFVERISKEIPHTLIVIVADHGIFWDEKIGDGIPDADMFRQIARIPMFIHIPGLPEDLRGEEVASLGSNVDIAPTLLSLMGHDSVRQQFMGEDIFSRTNPVYIDWQGKLLEIRAEGQDKLSLRYAGPVVEDTLGALIRYNMLAPVQKLAPGG